MSRVHTRRWLAVATTLAVTAAPLAAQPAAARLAALLDSLTLGLVTTGFRDRLDIPQRVLALPEVTRAAWAQDAALWRRVARAAAQLPTDSLSPEDQRTVQLLRWEGALQGTRAPHWWVDFSTVTPYASPVGDVANGLRALPLSRAEEVATYRRVLAAVPAFVDTITAGIDQRAARGIRLSRQAIPGSVATLRRYVATGAANPFAIDEARLAATPAALRDSLRALNGTLVDGAIVPAVQRLIDRLSGTYATRAPAGVGLGQYPGGAAYYQWLVRWHTTMETTPAALHRTGLAEVARLERELDAIRREVGFTGSLAAFKASLATNPRFFATRPEEIGERLMGYAQRLEPLLDAQFARRPRARGDAQRLPEALEGAMTFGYYRLPTATDSMGHYFYNGSKLPERSLLTAAPLIAHELWPGHHFQLNLVREDPQLPAWRQQKYYTAYGEGWGDYASIVAGDLGLYADPYDRVGRLAMDLFISCRLVVDTGMHAFGWPRARAAAFMQAHAFESPTQIASETLRYSTDLPGQALAYKAGSLEFVRLRARAQAHLGTRYDPRAFHAQVLESGMLPMAVLAEKVEGWLRTSRR